MPGDVDAGLRGSQAAAPRWREVLRGVRREVASDHIDLVAAGVAFYWLLSVFPAMIAAVSIWGLVADPADVARVVETLGETMPQQARDVLGGQLSEVAGGARGALGVGTVVGVAVALWGALKGTKALMTGLNIAYDEQETRSFASLNGFALLLLLALLVTGAVATAGVIVLPAVLGSLGIGGLGYGLLVGSWPLVAVGVAGFLALAYRFGPSRDAPGPSRAVVGAVLATVVWLAGSALFSLYVARFDSYNETYGSIAGVVVLLMWFWLTAFSILLGAEVNHELERQATLGPT